MINTSQVYWIYSGSFSSPAKKNPAFYSSNFLLTNNIHLNLNMDLLSEICNLAVWEKNKLFIINIYLSLPTVAYMRSQLSTVSCPSEFHLRAPVWNHSVFSQWHLPAYEASMPLPVPQIHLLQKTMAFVLRHMVKFLKWPSCEP